MTCRLPAGPLQPLMRRFIRPLAFPENIQTEVMAFGHRLTATLLDLLGDDGAESAVDDNVAAALICHRPVGARLDGGPANDPWVLGSQTSWSIVGAHPRRDLPSDVW